MGCIGKRVVLETSISEFISICDLPSKVTKLLLNSNETCKPGPASCCRGSRCYLKIDQCVGKYLFHALPTWAFFFSFLEIHLPEHLWINETQLHARENGRQGKSSSRMSVQRYKVIQFSERKVIPCAPWERISGEARESQRAETGPHWGQVFGHSLIAIKQNQPKHNSFKQSVYFAYDI